MKSNPSERSISIYNDSSFNKVTTGREELSVNSYSTAVQLGRRECTGLAASSVPLHIYRSRERMHPQRQPLSSSQKGTVPQVIRYNMTKREKFISFIYICIPRRLRLLFSVISPYLPRCRRCRRLPRFLAPAVTRSGYHYLYCYWRRKAGVVRCTVG